MRDKSPSPHSRNPVHQRIDVALQIIQPRHLRIDEILRYSARTTQKIAVNLAEEQRMLVEQRLAKVWHLRHIPKCPQSRLRACNARNVFVLDQHFQRLMIFCVACAGQ